MDILNRQCHNVLPQYSKTNETTRITSWRVDDQKKGQEEIWLWETTKKKTWTQGMAAVMKHVMVSGALAVEIMEQEEAETAEQMTEPDEVQ